MRVVTKNKRETQKIAAQVAARVLHIKPQKHALVIALEGELGAGKTTFAQGFIRALGVKAKVKSPTFLLIKKYDLAIKRTSRFLPFAFRFLYHIDCYRVKNWKELESLEIKQIVGNPENIVMIEWPERIRPILPRQHIKIRFEHVSLRERKVTILKFPMNP